jgi:phosphatidylglycerophosphate synthase
LIATELVLGKSLLSHTIDHALRLAPGISPIMVIADEADRPVLNGLLDDWESGPIELTGSPPSSDALTLRTDRLYETRRLRKAAAMGGDPESAVVWRLDDPRSIEVAGDELSRRRTYQPLGRYWAFPIARAIADRLVASPVRPNALTLAAGGLMIAASILIATAPSTFVIRMIVAVALATALVLDTADGRLARIQGTSSPFGRWLDNVLDELADVALHAAIAWAAFVGTGQAGWLALGILYASGKYLFVVQSMAGETLDRAKDQGADSTTAAVAGESRHDRRGSRGMMRLAVQAMGHADLRWHLWIALAAVGRLDAALAVYAIYFPIRTGMSCLKRGVEHVVS